MEANVEYIHEKHCEYIHTRAVVGTARPLGNEQLLDLFYVRIQNQLSRIL